MIPTVRVTRGSLGASTRRFTLTRVDGGEPTTPFQCDAGACQVGSHALNDFVVTEPTVSRFHCEVGIGPDGAWVRDLGSANGTLVDGVQVKEAFLRSGSALQLGAATLRFSLSTEAAKLPVARRTRFGDLLGVSTSMRACFSQLERAAATSRPVLLEGETGTGKTLAAEAIHSESARKDKPFIAFDCSALPGAQLATALFGREGGADGPRRIGAFEEAGAGTVFLDEVGELSADLQSRLLVVLEQGELHRGGTVIRVQARVLAATGRELRSEVNAGRFRPELFYRLAVLRVVMPPLRERPEDLPVLVDHLLERLGIEGPQADALRSADFLGQLQTAVWPGNVRELRNHLERCLVLQDALPPLETHREGRGGSASRVDSRLGYAEARRLALDDFERQYLTALLAAHRGKVLQAAAAAGVDRVYLYRLLKRHGIKSGR